MLWLNWGSGRFWDGMEWVAVVPLPLHGMGGRWCLALAWVGGRSASTLACLPVCVCVCISCISQGPFSQASIISHLRICGTANRASALVRKASGAWYWPGRASSVMWVLVLSVNTVDQFFERKNFSYRNLPRRRDLLCQREVEALPRRRRREEKTEKRRECLPHALPCPT